MNIIKNKLRAVIPHKLIDFASFKPHTPFESISYGQNGEDLILKNVFANKGKGFYVDVGAHHPFRFSNTFLFYQLGWRGINIDPLPGIKQLFDKYRPNDINVEAGVSTKTATIPYYMFNHPAMNTFSKELADMRIKESDPLQDIRQISVRPLSKILNEYLSPSQDIDFMNIDVEGFDFEVLKSNDWQKNKPKVIVYEELGDFDNQNISNSPTFNYLIELGYSFYTRVNNSIFFKIM